MAMSSFSDQDLDFFLEHGMNVLFEGKHGVGKTHIILDAFKRNKLRFAYFSASTLDPWVDFVGVPRPQVDKETGLSYLELIRPKLFVLGKVQAIFVDEYNRGHKKIRNAIMELIQFGTINGFPLKDLRVVWAAINPADEDDLSYDTEELDPAQRDRFQVHITVPYKPSLSFFKEKFGESVANIAIEWWNDLPKETKNLVSPRRLEYALDMSVNGGDINFILPSESNPSKLNDALLDGPMLDRLIELAHAGDVSRGKLELAKDPNLTDCMLANFDGLPNEFADFWLPLVPLDSIMSLVSSDDYALFYVVTHAVQIRPLARIVTAIIRANDLSMDGWKVLFSMVCPLGRHSDKSVAEQIQQNPYKAYLNDLLVAADFDSVFLTLPADGTVPEVHGVLIGDGGNDFTPFLTLLRIFFNPVSKVYTYGVDGMKKGDTDLPDYYQKMMLQVYRMRGHFHRTVEVNGVELTNVVSLFAKALIFEICQKGGVSAMSLISNFLPSDVVDSGLCVIQAASGGNFGSTVSLADKSRLKTRSRGKTKSRRGRGRARK